jgi:hypothetical protein
VLADDGQTSTTNSAEDKNIDSKDNFSWRCRECREEYVDSTRKRLQVKAKCLGTCLNLSLSKEMSTETLEYHYKNLPEAAAAALRESRKIDDGALAALGAEDGTCARPLRRARWPAVGWCITAAGIAGSTTARFARITPLRKFS